MSHSPLSTAHKDALRSCRVLFEDSLNVDDILAQCLQDDVISIRMKARIEAKQTPHEKCSAFLDILQTRGRQAFDDFIVALKVDYGFLARSLEKELRIKALSLVNAGLVSANEIIVADEKLDYKESDKAKASIRTIQALITQLKTTVGIPKSIAPRVSRSNTTDAFTSPLSEAHKATLRSQRVLLQESLDVQHILPRCIQERVLSQEMKETVLSHSTRHQRCSAFLDILETRGKQDFDSFVSSLHDDYLYLELPIKRELRLQALKLATDALANANDIFDREVQSDEQQSTKLALESIESLISQLKVTIGIEEEFVDSTASVSSEPSPMMVTSSVSVKSIVSKMSTLESPSMNLTPSQVPHAARSLISVTKPESYIVKQTPLKPTLDVPLTLNQPPLSRDPQTQPLTTEPPDNVRAQLPPSSDSPSASQIPPTTGPSSVVKSQLTLQQPSTSHESTPSTSLVKQLKTLNLSSGHLSLTLTRKIELPAECFGLCSSPMGDIIASIYQHGIFVYNKDYTFKLTFALEDQSDVVCLPTDEIVVCSWRNNWVKVFDMEGNYKRQICKYVNKPYGLAFHPQLGIVVIGRDPMCLNICSISGQVLRTITNASFNNLYRVAISPYNKTLLVTDYKTSTLHCLDWEGNNVFAYKGDGDDGLDEPDGICCTDKHLLLVDSCNHRVFLLSHDGDLLKNLLTKEDGLEFPHEVMVDSSGNIVVGESSSGPNYLYVFKIDD
ncbi:unnamed protein product [Owenia fusiformis]|uniref:Uncharacterized protein n=1 Tax=Owenia fusiformis TaxID=6347 RepID=A0A8J1TV36_OWEFU|nr:unnamed protein product [Owenia fusiformis]